MCIQLCNLDIPREKWLNNLQTVKTDQTPRSAESDLGLHGMPITLLGVSKLQWVNAKHQAK